MPRHSIKHLDERRALAYLAAVTSAVAQRKKLRSFLQEFLTSAERAVIAQRLRVTRLLLAGHSYRLIQEETGARFGTVSKMDRWLRQRAPHYRQLFPLRARQRAPKLRAFPDTFRSLPGSAKDLFRSITGTSLW